jgi:hypothetical protein
MLLQDEELVNIYLIKIDANVKEKYSLLQNKGYANDCISGFNRENSQKIVLLLPSCAFCALVVKFPLFFVIAHS